MSLLLLCHITLQGFSVTDKILVKTTSELVFFRKKGVTLRFRKLVASAVNDLCKSQITACCDGAKATDSMYVNTFINSLSFTFHDILDFITHVELCTVCVFVCVCVCVCVCVYVCVCAY